MCPLSRRYGVAAADAPLIGDVDSVAAAGAAAAAGGEKSSRLAFIYNCARARGEKERLDFLPPPFRSHGESMEPEEPVQVREEAKND